jgi:hypothetical protein
MEKKTFFSEIQDGRHKVKADLGGIDVPDITQSPILNQILCGLAF